MSLKQSLRLAHLRDTKGATETGCIQRAWLLLSGESLENCLVGFWEGFFVGRCDANNLPAVLWAWHRTVT